jgi:WhiB family redox-sensing transcriptional regulator
MSAPTMVNKQPEEIPAWFTYAACADPDITPDTFFLPRGATAADTRAAKDICFKCSACEECLAYAMTNRETFGIWGGTTEKDRRAIRRQQRLARRAVAS